MNSKFFTFELKANIPDGDFQDDESRKKWINDNQQENIARVIDEAKAYIDKHLSDADDKDDHKFLSAVLDLAPTLLGRFNVACNIVLPYDPEDLTPERTWLKRKARFYATNLIKPSKQ